MNSKLNKIALSVSLAVALAACGGGGGDTAGIGGSGYNSSGSVTGFGSIFVNGVEFATNNATFTIEGVAGTQADLVEGMRVRVIGTANADGITGTAVQVIFDDQLEGPVSSVLTPDADNANKTFTVMGVTVKISAVDTVFVSTAGMDFATLVQNDMVQISGFYDSVGVLHATAIKDKGVFAVGTNDTVEAAGVVSALNGNAFTLTIGNVVLMIDATNADLTQIPSGLTNGQIVDVKGVLAAVTDTTVAATLIKLEDNPVAEGLEVELEGIITRFVSINDFDVDGHSVNAGTAILTPVGFTPVAGMLVEVEGVVTNGVLQAEKLIQRTGEVKIEAPASNVNVAAGTFDVTIAGQTITVSVDTSTRLKDKAGGETIAQALMNLDGNFVRVRGIEDNNNQVIATRVRIRTAGDIILEGVIDSQADGASVTVLGITMAVDANTTEFIDVNNAVLTDQAAFIAQVTNGVTIVKLRDREAGAGGNNAVGIADSVEIQPLL